MRYKIHQLTQIAVCNRMKDTHNYHGKSQYPSYYLICEMSGIKQRIWVALKKENADQLEHHPSALAMLGALKGFMQTVIILKQ